MFKAVLIRPARPARGSQGMATVMTRLAPTQPGQGGRPGGFLRAHQGDVGSRFAAPTHGWALHCQAVGEVTWSTEPGRLRLYGLIKQLLEQEHVPLEWGARGNAIFVR